ncbi:MAG: sigma 54-interacting transcriptional regulator [Deltaproteobacteria bacterium]|jgi:PAS domain S-box-containing protein|nr:sigma 54-interacting transcriptional regulator [Deltaproteobacteria bacterium]MBT4526658.1 sigma 54-interacting transcriptional regulator [Deltaproteobacteria bacterium]
MLTQNEDLIPSLLPRIVNQIPIGIALVDSSHKIRFVNDQLTQLTRLTQTQMIGNHCNAIFGSISSYIDNSLADQVHHFALELKEFEASLNVDLVPIQYENEDLFICINVHSNNQRARNSKIKAFENSLNMDLSEILEASFDGIWICDAEGRVQMINKASSKMNQLNPKSVIGKTMEELIASGLADRSVTLEVFKQRKPVTFIQNMHNGRKILATGSPVINEQGEITLVVVNERDITELSDLRTDLEKSKKLIEGYQSELNELSSQNQLFSVIVSQSQEVNHVKSVFKKASKSDVIVLVQGEPGTGKKELARSIHLESKRQKQPFVHYECGSLPIDIIEKELFGSNSNDDSEIGVIEMADKGTLYLEELAKLPLQLQVRLVEMLDDRQDSNMKSAAERKNNFRLIVSSATPLNLEVKNGNLREDLFYLISVVTINVPPLRKRIIDLAALVDFYLKRYNEKNEDHINSNPRVISILSQYDFPGNLRELANLTEQLAALSTSKKIEVGDLPPYIIPDSSWSLPQKKCDRLSLSHAVEVLEKQMITEAFGLYSNQTQVANHLGINQSTLSRKLKKYNIIINGKK